MRSPGGKLKALGMSPSKNLNKQEERTYLSTKLGGQTCAVYGFIDAEKNTFLILKYNKLEIVA